jgi:hypothetical protein
VRGYQAVREVLGDQRTGAVARVAVARPVAGVDADDVAGVDLERGDDGVGLDGAVGADDLRSSA